MRGVVEVEAVEEGVEVVSSVGPVERCRGGVVAGSVTSETSRTITGRRAPRHSIGPVVGSTPRARRGVYCRDDPPPKQDDGPAAQATAKPAPPAGLLPGPGGRSRTQQTTLSSVPRPDLC